MKELGISEIIEHLRSGKLIVYPTDTLYALGADIYNEDAVKKVYQLKNRPFSLPLPVAVPSIQEMKRIAYVNDLAEKLAKNFLPGKLTLILYKKDVPDIVTANSDKVAVRIPNNEMALKILRNYSPLTVTSANIHGEKVPSCIKEIKKLFGKDLLYIEGRELRSKPSTIVDCTSSEIKILREGAIPEKEIRKAIQDG